MALSRDLMAPDTEPTDEELAVVMREARDLAAQRRAIADAWMREQYEKALREALGRIGSAASRQ
jgi:hypothetical protein